MNTEDIGHRIITICGSMRYYNDMIRVAETFTQQGYIVLMPFVDRRAYDPDSLTTNSTDLAKMLDEMHKDKIRLSESIVVVGEHKGEQTRNEMQFALDQRKGILVLHPSSDDDLDPPCTRDVCYGSQT